VAAAKGYEAMAQFLRQEVPDLPIWYAEMYVDGEGIDPADHPERFEVALQTMQDAGVSVALLWGPECDGAQPGQFPCLWSSTTNTNGGQPTSYVPIMQRYAGRPE
jgi:hypothetical protein